MDEVVEALVSKAARVVGGDVSRGSATSLNGFVELLHVFLSERCGELRGRAEGLGLKLECGRLRIADWESYWSATLLELTKLRVKVFDTGMEVVARYIGVATRGLHSRLSVLMVGYSVLQASLVEAARRLAASKHMAFPALEPLVYASVLRFIGFCRFTARLGARRAAKLIDRIESIASEYVREDYGLRNILVAYAGG